MDNTAQGDPIWMTLYIIVVFLAVAALAVYALRFLARRWTGYGPVRHLRLVEQLYVAPNRSVCLVAVPGKILVLGVAERSVELLTVLDDPELVASLQPAAPAVGQGQFASMLGRLLGREGAAGNESDPGGAAAPPADESTRSDAMQSGLARLRELQRREDGR